MRPHDDEMIVWWCEYMRHDQLRSKSLIFPFLTKAWWTDGRTDRRTDRPGYTDVRTHLKMGQKNGPPAGCPLSPGRARKWKNWITHLKLNCWSIFFRFISGRISSGFIFDTNWCRIHRIRLAAVITLLNAICDLYLATIASNLPTFIGINEYWFHENLLQWNFALKDFTGPAKFFA